MMVYLALGLSAVLLTKGATTTDKLSVRRCLWLLAFLVLFIPAALRHDIGVDYSRYQGYEELFDIYTSGGSISEGMDIGFVLLIRVLGLFTQNAQWLFVVTSAFIIGLVLRACQKLSPDPTLSVALFLVAGLYLESLNIVRQWMAIACVLNALIWIKNDRGMDKIQCFIRYALWVVVGASFHASALLWLAVYPLFYLPLNSKRMVAVTLISTVGLSVCGAWLLPTVAGERFGRYLVAGAGGYASADPHIDSILTALVMLLFVCWARWHDKTWDFWTCCLGVCQALGVSLLLSGFFLPAIVDRVARYFLPLLILQLPWALTRIENKDLRQACALSMVACWLLVTFIRVGLGGQYGVVPYQWVFV